jgi:hypothetical protein
VGAIYTVGYAGMLVGVAVYNRYLKDYTYRRVFLYAQLLLAFIGKLLALAKSSKDSYQQKIELAVTVVSYSVCFDENVWSCRHLETL